jgi:hypothetical protein
MCTATSDVPQTGPQSHSINSSSRFRRPTITLPDWLTKNRLQHTFRTEKSRRASSRARRDGTTPTIYSQLAAGIRGKPRTTFNGFQKAKAEFDERCGVTGCTRHDLRRTFGTRLAALGVLSHFVERLLNHKMGSICNKTDGIVSAVAEIYSLAAYNAGRNDSKTGSTPSASHVLSPRTEGKTWPLGRTRRIWLRQIVRLELPPFRQIPPLSIEGI